MLRRGLEMSFSGLKTALRDEIYRRDANAQLDESQQKELASSLQSAIVDVLVHKACAALKETGYNRLTIGGGVAANGPLREALQIAAEKEGFSLYLPPKKWCTDNAAMIAAAADIRYRTKGADSFDIPAKARWPLVEEWVVRTAR
jgi:N6-L-threonylcarbamoyladenine synthase